MKKHWTEAEFKIALEMLARNESDAAFQERFGRTKKSVISRRDRLKYSGIATPKGARRARKPSYVTTGARVQVSEQARIDAMRRAAAPHPAFGDPPIGWSALDRKRSAEART